MHQLQWELHQCQRSRTMNMQTRFWTSSVTYQGKVSCRDRERKSRAMCQLTLINWTKLILLGLIKISKSVLKGLICFKQDVKVLGWKSDNLQAWILTKHWLKVEWFLRKPKIHKFQQKLNNKSKSRQIRKLKVSLCAIIRRLQKLLKDCKRGWTLPRDSSLFMTDKKLVTLIKLRVISPTEIHLMFTH